MQLYRRKGADVLVNTQTLNSQSIPNLAVLPGGGFVVVWTDGSMTGGDTSGFAIRGQRFDANGSAIGGEFLVNSTTSGNQTSSFVAALNSGRFVVTWTDASATGGDTSGNAVRGQLFEADGTPVGAEFLVNTETTNGQGSTTVSELTGGGFVVVWVDASAIGGDTSGTGVKAQLFDAGANKVGGEILVNTLTIGAQGQSGTNVIALAGGGFVVAWSGVLSFNGSIITQSARFQLFDAAGAKVGTEQVANAGNEGTFSSVNINALNAGFIITWAQQDSAPFPGNPVTFDIHAQMFDANGAEVGADFIVNTTRTGSQSAADVDRVPGGFLITWQGPAEGGSDTNLYGQFFADDGSPAGGEFIVTSFTSGDQSGPKVDVLPSGDIVIVWTEGAGAGSDGSGLAVKMQILTLSSDAPSDIVISDMTISEVAVENLPVALLGATSAALNSAFTYAIISDSSGGAFAIDGDRLVILENGRLDFETQPSVALTIRVTDSNGLSYEETLNLTISDAAVETRYAAQAEFRVSLGTETYDSPSAVTALSTGGFVIFDSWTTLGTNQPPTMGVRFRIYDENGALAAGPFELDVDDRPGSDYAVAALPGGGFIVAFAAGSVSIPGGNYYPIRAQMFDASGHEVGAEILVSTSAAGIQGEPAIAVLASGRFVVSWTLPVHEEPAGGGPFPGQIVAQLFDAGGARIGGEFRVNTTIEGEQRFSHAVALDNGGFVVTWTDNSSLGIRAQFFDPDGARVGGERTIFADDEDLYGTTDLVLLEYGPLLATWVDQTVEGDINVFEIHAQRLGTDGINIGDPLLLATIPTIDFAISYDIAATADGGFMLTFELFDPTAIELGYSDSWAQLYSAAGIAVGEPFIVTDSSAGRSEGVAMPATLLSGDLALAWTQGASAQDPSQSEASARLLTIADRAGGPINGTTGPDALTGTSGNDVINGLDGDDRIHGGAGSDRMLGGSGADRFVFEAISFSRETALRSDGAKTAPDFIADFETGIDRIDLSRIDAVRGTPANDAFTFIGSAAFTGLAGQLRCDLIGKAMHIYGDVDGNGIADFEIVAMTPILQATDFVL